MPRVGQGNAKKTADALCIHASAVPRAMEMVAYSDSDNAFIKVAISMAAVAASNPLLPILLPARSMACSIVSVVTKPKIHGTPVWVLTWATPAVTPAVTWS
jgi:hypothetical protein